MAKEKTLAVGDTLSYGELEIGKKELSIDYRTRELKQKLVNGEITPEEKEELTLLK